MREQDRHLIAPLTNLRDDIPNDNVWYGIMKSFQKTMNCRAELIGYVYQCYTKNIFNTYWIFLEILQYFPMQFSLTEWKPVNLFSLMN